MHLPAAPPLRASHPGLRVDHRASWARHRFATKLDRSAGGNTPALLASCSASTPSLLTSPILSRILPPNTRLCLPKVAKHADGRWCLHCEGLIGNRCPDGGVGGRRALRAGRFAARAAHLTVLPTPILNGEPHCEPGPSVKQGCSPISGVRLARPGIGKGSA